jgi:hypothetical protein
MAEQQRDAELEAIVTAAAVDGAPAQYLRSRWWPQTQWLDRHASRAHWKYVTLRVVTILGGVLLPLAVGCGGAPPAAGEGVGRQHLFSLILGVAVAAAAAIEAFFRFGERWRHYRRVAERLRSEGWLFAELGGRYAAAQDGRAAFPLFVARVEEILQGDVDEFFSRVATDDRAGKRAEAA